MSVDVLQYSTAASRDARPSMSGLQAVGTLDAGLIAMDTDVMSARSYSSDVEDGLRLAPDDSDADDTAAVPWPQLPLSTAPSCSRQAYNSDVPSHNSRSYYIKLFTLTSLPGPCDSMHAAVINKQDAVCDGILQHVGA